MKVKIKKKVTIHLDEQLEHLMEQWKRDMEMYIRREDPNLIKNILKSDFGSSGDLTQRRSQDQWQQHLFKTKGTKMKDLENMNNDRKDAYVLIWEDEERINMVIPRKYVECEDADPMRLCVNQKFVYLYDYRDAMDYIKKNLADVDSNIMMCKAVDLIKVDLKSVGN